MEEFNVIIVIVVVVVSILHIILFFKIWQMANDTATIRKTVSSMKATVDGLLYSAPAPNPFVWVDLVKSKTE